jgi:hypothetical protein
MTAASSSIVDTLSPLVIALIAIGACICVVLLIGGVLLLLRRRRNGGGNKQDEFVTASYRPELEIAPYGDNGEKTDIFSTLQFVNNSQQQQQQQQQ